jgi:hypothetical protein
MMIRVVDTAGARIPKAALVGRSLLTSRRGSVSLGECGSAGAFALPDLPAIRVSRCPSTGWEWLHP